jgi:hypothetical protein
MILDLRSVLNITTIFVKRIVCKQLQKLTARKFVAVLNKFDVQVESVVTEVRSRS